MAIQTGGFVPTSLARYTPSDPRLVAADPTQFTQGLGNVFALGSLFDRIKAFQADRSELEATRDARIAATLAKFNADAAQATAQTPVFGAKAQFDLANLSSLLNRLPSEEGASIATNRNIIDLAPSQLAAGIASNRRIANTAQAATDADLAKLAAERATAESVVATESDKRALVLATLADQLKNVKTDAERQRLMDSAKVELIKAQAEEARAQGGYYDRGGSGRTPKTKEELANRITTTMKNISTLPVADGRAFKVYLNDTRNDDGTIKKGGLFGFGGPVDLDDVGELYVEQYRALADELKQLSGATTTGKSIAPQTPDRPSQSSTQPKRLRFTTDNNGNVVLKQE